MTRRVRRWLMAVLAVVTTAVLVWLPAVAQAGISARGID
jgi:hypothetical protein